MKKKTSKTCCGECIHWTRRTDKYASKGMGRCDAPIPEWLHMWISQVKEDSPWDMRGKISKVAAYAHGCECFSPARLVP